VGNNDEWDFHDGSHRQERMPVAAGTELRHSSSATRFQHLGSPVAASGGAGLMAGLLPRVTKAQMLEPLCRSDCDACQSLAKFVGNMAALELPMMLPSKKLQQHVLKVVGWLASPSGGGHHLSCSDGSGGDRGGCCSFVVPCWWTSHCPFVCKVVSPMDRIVQQ
jgi:hypothetical protein